MDKRTRANYLVTQLLGTCNALPDEVYDDLELCELIDEEIQECECCGWWCETCEMDDNNNCEDCRNER